MKRALSIVLMSWLLGACSGAEVQTPGPVCPPSVQAGDPPALPSDDAEVAKRVAAAGAESRSATVNGVKLHYLFAGKGSPIVLVHGYAETSFMWLPLIAELAKTHTVIAPDLRGSGTSDKPETGYDKKTLAQDIHALVQSLGSSGSRWSGTTSA